MHLLPTVTSRKCTKLCAYYNLDRVAGFGMKHKTFMMQRFLPVLRWFLLFVTLAVGLWLIDRAGRATPGDHVLAGSVALICFVLALGLDRLPPLRGHLDRRRVVSRRVSVFFWIAGGLLLPWATLQQLFGSYHFSAVLFHAQEGMGSQLDTWLILPGVVSFLLILVLLHLAQSTLRRIPLPSLSMAAAGVAMLVVNPLHVYLFQRAIWDRLFPVPSIHQALEPVGITEVPDRPLNVVLVFLEGAEATYGTSGLFGDAYEPLHRLGRQGRVFEGVAQVETIGHSIAGMVAAQCGLPLVPNGLVPTKRAGQRGGFLPGHLCLGDVLAEQGYVSEFIVGAAVDYGGIERFYYHHGFDRVLGLADLREPGPHWIQGFRGQPGVQAAVDTPPTQAPHEVMRWGVHDSIVFEAALERARVLQGGGQPWSLVLETIGPHGPDVFMSPPCRRPGEGQTHKDILRGVACIAALAEDFVARLFEISPPEDTLVVVVSDHLAHKMVSATPELSKLERHNTAIFLGAGLQQDRIGKPGSMLDIYPTILETLGYGLSGDQAGMGISLLSQDRATLVETYGTFEIDRRLGRDTALARIIWQGPDTKPAD